MCLGVFLFGSNFFGTIWASWISQKSISFARLGKFSFIICSNKFQFLAPVLLLLAPLWFGYWNISGCHRDFSASHQFFEFLFLHSVLVRFLFLPFVPNCWFKSWFPSCHCWFPEYFALFHFGYLSFVLSFFDQAKSVLWAFWLPGF